MGEILELAESMWNGQTDTYASHPFGRPYGIERVAEGTWFYKGFANTIIRETDDGLIIVDPGAFRDAGIKFTAVRSVTPQRLNTAIFTHGHVDHCFGVSFFMEEARSKGWPMPRVIGHEAMPARFQPYRDTVGYNSIINSRQFQGGAREVSFPTDYYYPDITYENSLTISVGGVRVFLRHARGETDDHTWAYFPDIRLACPGDLIIWMVPNVGNPQKAQRYCRDGAVALREMAAFRPEILMPGHGWPIIGSDRVQLALDETATLLESLHDQTINLMNTGASLDTIIHTVKAPEELLRRPYLHAVYDEPEFIVRNIWRLYGGWYDGTPSHLKPSPERTQAEEIARLAGGAHKLAERATELATQGNFRLASHLADWAYLAAQNDSEVREAAAHVYVSRAQSETSTMAMGVFLARAREMEGKQSQTDVPGETVRTVLQMQDERGRKT